MAFASFRDDHEAIGPHRGHESDLCERGYGFDGVTRATANRADFGHTDSRYDLACLRPCSRAKIYATTAGRWRIAKSPRCQTSSSGPTISFQRSIMASFIAATDAKGRR